MTTDPISDSDLDDLREAPASSVYYRSLIARIDLERNRADEAVRAMEANIVTLEQCGEELNAAEAECERLREAAREAIRLTEEYVGEYDAGDPPGPMLYWHEGWSHYDALHFIAALAAPPDPKEPSDDARISRLDPTIGFGLCGFGCVPGAVHLNCTIHRYER